LYDNYTGSISYNGISLRDLNKASLLDHLGDYVSQEGIFDGSVLENIVIGRPNCKLENVQWAIEAAGLSGFVHGLPQGLNTRLVGGNVRISDSVSRKIIIARNIVERPSLLVLDDFLLGVERREKRRILELILSPEFNWTVILISNDPMIMSAADRLILMRDGSIVEDGVYSELKKSSTLLQELLQENSMP
jgi:ABC-type multidrug transport system fused ATPase/permease subunit